MAKRNVKHRWYVIQTKPMSEDKVCMQFNVCRPREGGDTPNTPREIIEESLKLFEPGLKVGDKLQNTVTCHLSPVTGFETFCPKIKCVSGGKKGERGERFKPLFPSYIFLRGELADPAHHHLVKYTRGVNKVLGDGAKPVPIADEIVDIIKARVDSGGLIEQNTFKRGDLVKVKKGHLRELIGVLERPVSDAGRVAVLLNLFNRQMRVDLSCADIMRA